MFNTQRFKLEDLDASAKVGCRGCQLLRALVEGACKIYPELETGDPVLRWVGSRYTLEIERDPSLIRVRASLGNAFWRRRCTGSSPGRSGRRGLPRADYALHAAEPSEPFKPSEPKVETETEPLGKGSAWVLRSFKQRGLDLMGGDFSCSADAVVDDLDRYGFESCVGKGSCKVAPCYLLHVPRNERQSLAYRSQKKNKKDVDADAFLVLARSTTGSDTFERVGLIQVSHDTAEKRSAWFEKVWSSIVLPEKTITLI